jgi:hypothetical protein
MDLSANKKQKQETVKKLKTAAGLKYCSGRFYFISTRLTGRRRKA